MSGNVAKAVALLVVGAVVATVEHIPPSTLRATALGVAQDSRRSLAKPWGPSAPSPNPTNGRRTRSADRSLRAAIEIKSTGRGAHNLRW